MRKIISESDSGAREIGIWILDREIQCRSADLGLYTFYFYVPLAGPWLGGALPRKRLVI
jgi:hypothetical protein